MALLFYFQIGAPSFCSQLFPRADSADSSKRSAADCNFAYLSVGSPLLICLITLTQVMRIGKRVLEAECCPTPHLALIPQWLWKVLTVVLQKNPCGCWKGGLRGPIAITTQFWLRGKHRRSKGSLFLIRALQSRADQRSA